MQDAPYCVLENTFLGSSILIIDVDSILIIGRCTVGIFCVKAFLHVDLTI